MEQLEDRLRLVALAGGLLDYLPQARQSSSTLTGSPGAAGSRVVPCRPCGARGRVTVKREPCAACVPRVGPKAPPVHRPRHGCLPCLVCEGTGWRRRRQADARWDEYVGEELDPEREQSVSDLLVELARGFGTKDAMRQRESAWLHQERLLEEWAFQRGEREDPARDDPVIEGQRRLYRGGSFAELAQALDSLRWAMPNRALLWWRRFVLGEEIWFDAIAAVSLVETTDWILLRMPRPIVLPDRLEPQRVNEERKRSLQHGKTPAHKRARDQRDAHIRELREQGWTYRRIGRLYHLDVARIKRICDKAAAKC